MAPLTWYNNYTPKDAVLASPAAYSVFTGTDCSVLPRPDVRRGRLRPDYRHERGQARLRAHDLRHLPRHRPEVTTSGSGTPPAAATGESRLRTQPAEPEDRRLLAVPQHDGLDHADDAAERPHAHPRHANLLGLPHGQSRHGRRATPRWRASRCCIRASPPAAPSATAARRRSTFYNNNDNPKAAPATHIPSFPPFTSNDCSACHKANYAAGGFGPMNMTAGHAHQRVEHGLQDLPRSRT